MSLGRLTIRRSSRLLITGTAILMLSGPVVGDNRAAPAAVTPSLTSDLAADVHKLVEADWIDSDRRFGVTDAAAPVAVKPVTTAEDAAGGCDGVKNGLWGFHVASGETDPWWQVDLGKECRLDRVVVYNRCDSREGRTANLQILVTLRGGGGKRAVHPSLSARRQAVRRRGGSSRWRCAWPTAKSWPALCGCGFPDDARLRWTKSKCTRPTTRR